MSQPEKNRKWWGWGLRDRVVPSPEGLLTFLQERLSPWPDWTLPPPDLEGLDLRPAEIPPGLQAELQDALGPENVRDDRFTRVLHALGRSYRDLIRLRLGRIPAPPDVVVYPQNHEQVRAVLEAARRFHAAVIPFGGGSSVVGGLEAAPELRPIICLDLTRMNQVLAVNSHDLTARVQTGIFGPDLEEALARTGHTLGHFPQSFEFSTLGGWIATRGAGHKSIRYGKIEDMVLALKAALPDGEIQTPNAPASAAGGDLAQFIIGSEGSLGVITEAEIKIRTRPPASWESAFLFPGFEAGLNAIRTIMAKGLRPAALRLSDITETAVLIRQAKARKTKSADRFVLEKLLPKYLAFKGIKPEEACLLVAADEGEGPEIRCRRREVSRICRAAGAARVGAGPARAWRDSRYEAPYWRDDLIERGLLIETIETAAAWDRLPALQASVCRALEKALNWSGTNGLVMTHLSHAYPEGANLYFTFLAPQVRGREEEQWRRAKEAACRAVIDQGGALSHHHGVGRDHKPWIEEYWGRDGLRLFKAAKAEADPAAILNPGVLFDPDPSLARTGLEKEYFSPARRAAHFKRFPDQTFDLVVIGGGIVGAGVVWDATIRGLSAALVEKNDYAGGTSSKSSRMVHGGLRYLKMLDLKLVRESLAERHHLMWMAPHLVKPRKHLIPIYKGEGDSRTVLHIGLWGYDTLAGSKGLPHHETLTAEETLVMEPALQPEGLEGGLVYYDCLTDDARLTLAVIKAAARAGASPVNYARVDRVEFADNMAKVFGADSLTGQSFKLTARAVVNAAGVWADEIRKASLAEAENMLRPAKGIHITFPAKHKPIREVVILKGEDGRPLFAVPSGDMVYVGTTDDDYQGSLDDLHAGRPETDYLLDAVNRVLAGEPLKREQITASWAGLRPLISSGKEGETVDVSREHELRVENERLITVCGGKLTTFRVMAAQTVDRVLEVLGREDGLPSPTAGLSICGPPGSPDLSRTGFPETVTSRLAQKYGPQAEAILTLAQSPLLAAVLDPGLGLLAAEVYWSVQGEMAMTLIDAMTRRLGLAYLTRDNGLKIAPKVARIMAPLLGWTEAEEQAQVREYLDLMGRECAFREE